MSTTTTNYGLIKPDTTDPILIGQLNDNSDAIDAALKENADAIENKPDAADIPSPSTAAPAMDGTAAAGTSTDYARADHVHPSDTSKQDALTAAQLAAVNSGIDSAKVEQIETNKNNISLNTKYGGGRNIGNFAYYGLNPDQSIAEGTITHTESNGIFTFTGTANSSKNYACYLLKKQLIKAGNYVVSGISGGSTSTYWLRIGTGISDTFKMNVTDSGTILTLDSDTKITVQLVIKAGLSISNKVFSPMIITSADWANSHDFQPYAMSNAELTAKEQANENDILSIQQEQIVQNREIETLREITNCKLYGFKIDKQDVNPDTRVTYLYDAVGMTPAYMDFSGGSFNYGSWGDIWFIAKNRPVALKYDGTVDYELSHTDFTKKIDGETASDVEDVNYAGNFMSEMPLVYVKRWEDERYNYTVFSETKPNDDYLAQAHTNANGTVNPYIYLPMFKGYKDGNGKLRSLMGTTPWNTTGGTSNEVTAASACGDGWQLLDKAKIDLIMDLIVLITKSTSCRAKIGNGVCNTGSSASALVKSGYEKNGSTRSTNAQFFGTEGTDSSGYGQHHMCAFYIEDLWGNRWDRCLGFNIVSNVYKVKMVAPYLLFPDSTYQTLTITPPSSTEGWLKNVSSGVWGDVPTEVGASNTSGFANYFSKSTSDNRLSLFGGRASYGLAVGRSWALDTSPSTSSWSVGGSPCYNATT